MTTATRGLTPSRGPGPGWSVPVDRFDRVVMRSVVLQARPIIGSPVRWFLRLHGTDIPPRCLQGTELVLPHGGGGIVIHYRARLGSRVTIFPGVTIGRSDIWRPERADFDGILVEDDAFLCTGAKVLCSTGTLRVGRGSVVGANAVLTRSTGEWEVWAGVPARRIGMRTPAEPLVAGTLHSKDD